MKEQGEDTSLLNPNGFMQVTQLQLYPSFKKSRYKNFESIQQVKLKSQIRSSYYKDYTIYKVVFLHKNS